MALVKFFKVAVLPGTLEADAFYYVENGSYAESYITNSAGTAKAVGNSAMINALIDAAITDALADYNTLEIVADIAARNALALARNALVLVIDASADATVAGGSALYAYNEVAASWTKVAEYESMDVVIQWSAIQGAPSSTPAQIDSTVSQAHSHNNKPVLDDLSDNAGQLNYKGAAITTEWQTNNW